jgi:hypothetical protein
MICFWVGGWVKGQSVADVDAYFPTLRGEAAKNRAPVFLFAVGRSKAALRSVNSREESTARSFPVRVAQGQDDSVKNKINGKKLRQRLVDEPSSFPPFAVVLRRMGQPRFFVYGRKVKLKGLLTMPLSSHVSDARREAPFFLLIVCEVKGGALRMTILWGGAG